MSVLILLAEDEALIGATLQEALQDGGFSVRHVQSGREAIDAFDAVPESFSGIVTDIRLGDGPDGWDVARHAREVISTMPVVYMSADSAHEHAARGVPDSVMLQKPFALSQLITAVSGLLNDVPPERSA